MTSDAPPPLRLPDPVRRDFEAHRRGLAGEFERMLLESARPCVAVVAERVSEFPLRRNVLRRALGWKVSPPVLGVTDSKFGGVPYSEPGEDWSQRAFLGQIDLAEASAVLPSDAGRLRGMLRLTMGGVSLSSFAAQWFESPDPQRAQEVSPRSVGKWESRLRFRRSWTLPDGDWLDENWPLGGGSWTDYDRFHPDGYDEDGDDEFHRLVGHRVLSRGDHYGPIPPTGLDGYEQLLRVTSDSAAGLAWGTNWLYLFVPREDLCTGDLSRVVATAGNY